MLDTYLGVVYELQKCMTNKLQDELWQNASSHSKYNVSVIKDKSILYLSSS